MINAIVILVRNINIVMAQVDKFVYFRSKNRKCESNDAERYGHGLSIVVNHLYIYEMRCIYEIMRCK